MIIFTAKGLHHNYFQRKRFKVLVYPRTIILRHRFTVGRLTQTLLQYIFSESLIVLDYDGLFTNVKCLRWPNTVLARAFADAI